MASLSCLTIFEAGQFGSDPGNVIHPTADVPFPITMSGRGSGAGVSYGRAVKSGISGSARIARGAGASWGYAEPLAESNADQDDLFVIFY